MRQSSTAARLITILIAVVLTPVALGLLANGGTAWLFTAYRYADPSPDFGALAGPILLQVLAIALLAIVVLTGIWSSAGLIAVGVMSLVPLLIALVPGLLMPLYQAPLPREWVDGITYGVPLAIMPVLGTMGLVIAIVRRQPEPRGAMPGILGIVIAPLLLAGGGWLLVWGVGKGMLWALMRFRFGFELDAIAAVLVGTLLIVAGIGLTRWSAYALVLPAAFVILLSVLAAFPAMSSSLFGAFPREMSPALINILVFGGIAIAIIYLTYTVVLLRVRAQSRLVPPPTAYPQPDSNAAAGAYPPPAYLTGGAVPPPAAPPVPPVPGA